MNEDFLHYIWKYKKLDLVNLKTTNQQEITLVSVGSHNEQNTGPDFFNAILTIDGQKWAGNVEIHKKASDWYVHNHEKDKNYDNVILHVVWEDDVPVYRRDNTVIPALQLKEYVPKEYLIRYKKMFKRKRANTVLCDAYCSQVSSFVISNWQERLFIERLEEKSKIISQLLKNTSNNWEAVLFKLLTKNFGLKVNGEAFLSIANSFDFSILRKCDKSQYHLEALLFGQAGLLVNTEIEYVQKLKEEYDFLKTKFKLNTEGVIPVQFFRLRPSNFPTIRLAQLAGVYCQNKALFNAVVQATTIQEIYELFRIDINGFWEDHYTFDKQSTLRKKNITKSFVHLILINTIIPIKFIYAKNQGKNIADQIFELASNIPSEQNSIVSTFKDLKMPVKNAMNSQAMIQLKTNYCDHKKCLQCEIGNYLLNRG